MLQFFRKYQKIVFVLVTFFVAVSFLFFGPMTRGLDQRALQDREVATAIDGYPIMQTEVSQLAHFLATDAMDMPTGYQPVNLLNDGVIKKDFLKSSLGKYLFKAFRENLEKEMHHRLAQAKKYRPYIHPHFSALSAENIWKQLSPTMMENITALQKLEEPSEEAFSQLVRLYLLEAEFPAHHLKQMIAYQENQLANLPKDPSLPHRDLQLFGFRSLHDWFGKDFCDLCAQLIINVSRLAKMQGIQISDSEVERSLVENFQQALIVRKIQGEESFEDLFHQQLKILGLDFSQAKALWKKVLLFRAYFQEQGKNIEIETLEEDSSFEKAVIHMYQMEPAAHISSLEDLLKLELYLQAVAGKEIGDLDLPDLYYSARKVAEVQPGLVYQSYKVQIARASKKDLELRVPLRELFDYQLKPKTWQLLSEEFSVLKTKDPISREQRFHLLEKLDPSTRKKADSLAIKWIIEDHPEWIEEELQKAPRKTYTLEVSSEPQFPQLASIKKPDKFAQWLEEAEVGKSWDYTEDEEVYFSVKIEEKDATKQIFSFAQAQEKRALDPIMQSYLKNGYPNWRKRAPAVFQDDNGNWKSVYQAQADLLTYALRDLCKQIDQEAISQGEMIDWKEGFGPSSFYVKRRFLRHLHHVKKQLEKGEDSKWIHPEVLIAKLDKQWAVVHKKYTLLASRVTEKEKQEITRLQEEEFSHLLDVPYSASVCFFQLKNKVREEEHAALTKSMVEALAMDLLTSLQAHNNIRWIDREAQKNDDHI